MRLFFKENFNTNSGKKIVLAEYKSYKELIDSFNKNIMDDIFNNMFESKINFNNPKPISSDISEISGISGISEISGISGISEISGISDTSDDSKNSMEKTGETDNSDNSDTLDTLDTLDSSYNSDTSDNSLESKIFSDNYIRIDMTSEKSFLNQKYRSKTIKKYREDTKKKLKKEKITNCEIEYKYYSGGTVSGYDKNSPFIDMMIKRRFPLGDICASWHIAAFVPDFNLVNKCKSWDLGKMAIGENSERERFGNQKLNTHAEMDALQKLSNLIRIKRCKKQKMDLIVIRINKSGNLCESAPCFHCTKEMIESIESDVVSINKLYFSRYDGSITCVKFSEWIKNPEFHITKGWKRINH
jgi:hypothetical protein